MFKDDKDFHEKLAIGLSKENMLIDILNLSGIPASKYNVENVKEIDIELHEDNLLIDCKYMLTPYHLAYSDVGIQAMNCLTFSERHIKSYEKKEELTNKKVWLACIIDYKEYDVYELRFFPNSYLRNAGLSSKDNKIYADRRNGKNFYEFMSYVKNLKLIKDDKYSYDKIRD